MLVKFGLKGLVVMVFLLMFMFNFLILVFLKLKGFLVRLLLKVVFFINFKMIFFGIWFWNRWLVILDWVFCGMVKVLIFICFKGNLIVLEFNFLLMVLSIVVVGLIFFIYSNMFRMLIFFVFFVWVIRWKVGLVWLNFNWMFILLGINLFCWKRFM